LISEKLKTKKRKGSIGERGIGEAALKEKKRKSITGERYAGMK